MPIRFRCEDCDARMKVPDGSQGRRVKCPKCGVIQMVPPQTAVGAAAVAPAATPTATSAGAKDAPEPRLEDPGDPNAAPGPGDEEAGGTAGPMQATLPDEPAPDDGDTPADEAPAPPDAAEAPDAIKDADAADAALDTESSGRSEPADEADRDEAGDSDAAPPVTLPFSPPRPDEDGEGEERSPAGAPSDVASAAPEATSAPGAAQPAAALSKPAAASAEPSTPLHPAREADEARMPPGTTATVPERESEAKEPAAPVRRVTPPPEIPLGRTSRARSGEEDRAAAAWAEDEAELPRRERSDGILRLAPRDPAAPAFAEAPRPTPIPPPPSSLNTVGWALRGAAALAAAATLVLAVQLLVGGVSIVAALAAAVIGLTLSGTAWGVGELAIDAASRRR